MIWLDKLREKIAPQTAAAVQAVEPGSGSGATLSADQAPAPIVPVMPVEMVEQAPAPAPLAETAAPKKKGRPGYATPAERHAARLKAQKQYNAKRNKNKKRNRKRNRG